MLSLPEIAKSMKTLLIMWNFSTRTPSPIINTTLKLLPFTYFSCYQAIKLKNFLLNFSLFLIKTSKILIFLMLFFLMMQLKKEIIEKYFLLEIKTHFLIISAHFWTESLKPSEPKLPKVRNVHMPRFLSNKHWISFSLNLLIS
jgi:hypothetical protein